MKNGRNQTDVLSIERSLGLKSERGISRRGNKDAPPLEAILKGIKSIMVAYVNRDLAEIRDSDELKGEATRLFDEYGPYIWPGPEEERPHWLETPSIDRYEGKYPQERHYTNPEDREYLKDLFVQLVIEKACNYHENQLQKQRRQTSKALKDQLQAEPGAGEGGAEGERFNESIETPPQGDYVSKMDEFQSQFAAYAQPVPSQTPPPRASVNGHHADASPTAQTPEQPRSARKRPRISSSTEGSTPKRARTESIVSQQSGHSQEDANDHQEPLLVTFKVGEARLKSLAETGKVVPNSYLIQTPNGVDGTKPIDANDQDHHTDTSTRRASASGETNSIEVARLPPSSAPPPSSSPNLYRQPGSHHGFVPVNAPAAPQPQHHMQPPMQPPVQPLIQPLMQRQTQSPHQPPRPSPIQPFRPGLLHVAPSPHLTPAQMEQEHRRQQEFQSHQFRQFPPPPPPQPLPPFPPRQQPQPPPQMSPIQMPPGSHANHGGHPIPASSMPEGPPPSRGAHSGPIDLTREDERPTQSRTKRASSLAEEVLGEFLRCHVAETLVQTYPTMDRHKLENLRSILARYPETRTNLDELDKRIREGRPISDQRPHASAQPLQKLESLMTRPSSQPKPPLHSPVVNLTPQPHHPTQPVTGSPQLKTESPSLHKTKSEPMDSKDGILPQRSTLTDIMIEINWNRDLEFSDHAEMQDVETVQQFFDMLDQQRPDELRDDGRIVKEVRVKSNTSLQGGNVLPRIMRDEARGRAAMKHLIKKLKSQPPELEVELEFSVVWA